MRDSRAHRSLEVRRLGPRPVRRGAARCSATLVEERRAGRVGDLLLLVEHPHVLTLGVRGDGGRSHILATPRRSAARGIEVTRPAAAATSPTTAPGRSSAIRSSICKPDRCDVHRYVRDLEEVLIRVGGRLRHRRRRESPG